MAAKKRAGKKLHLSDLPQAEVSRILNFLEFNDLASLACVDKPMLKTVRTYRAWPLISFHRMMSKAGYTALRNYNLFRVDKGLKNLSVLCKNEKEGAIYEQQNRFRHWCLFTFIMLSLVVPILACIDVDSSKISLDTRGILAPVTLAWVLMPIWLLATTI